MRKIITHMSNPQPNPHSSSTLLDQAMNRIRDACIPNVTAVNEKVRNGLRCVEVHLSSSITSKERRNIEELATPVAVSFSLPDSESRFRIFPRWMRWIFGAFFCKQP